MRVLLDENLPRQLARELAGHDVRTVAQMGWASLKNGALLAAMVSGRFEALLTMDKNLHKQQRVADLPFGVVLIRAVDNQLATILPLVQDVLRALAVVTPGQVVAVGER